MKNQLMKLKLSYAVGLIAIAVVASSTSVAQEAATRGRRVANAPAAEATVTVNEQQLELPALSAAQQTTVVVPSGKTEPDGGAQVTLSNWQLSVALGTG